MKSKWILGLAAASMMLVLAGCGNRDGGTSDTTSSGGSSSTGGASSQVTDGTNDNTGRTDLPGDSMPGTDGRNMPNNGLCGGLGNPNA